MAQVDYFLKISDIPGESTDSKHKGEIDILSFSWGATNTAARSSGKVTVQDIQFTKNLDKASPNLMQHCATGKHFDGAVLTCRKAGSNPQEFLVIKLTDVLITGYTSGANPTDTGFSALQGNGPTADQFSLNFEKIEMNYTASDGTTAVGSIDLTPIP
jgi:type VI secretion system secreted protein Hcp